MINIINTFLLPGVKLMSEMHLKQPGFNTVHADHLQKTKKKYKNWKKLVIQGMPIKMN